MLQIQLDPASKKLSLADPESLSANELEQAENAVANVNRIMGDLVNLNSDIPKPQPGINTQISTAAAKLAGSGTELIKKNKPEEAVKLLSTSLEMVLRRPYWESAATVIDEISRVLGPRCDAYIAAQMWPEAYADASMLMVLKGDDASSYYRKGLTLLSCGKSVEAHELIATSVRMAPTQSAFRKTLEALQKQMSGGASPSPAS